MTRQAPAVIANEKAMFYLRWASKAPSREATEALLVKAFQQLARAVPGLGRVKMPLAPLPRITALPPYGTPSPVFTDNEGRRWCSSGDVRIAQPEERYLVLDTVLWRRDGLATDEPRLILRELRQ